MPFRRRARVTCPMDVSRLFNSIVQTTTGVAGYLNVLCKFIVRGCCSKKRGAVHHARFGAVAADGVSETRE